jgi:hypothetical protein
MAELIASGTTEADSADVTVAAGTPVTFCLKVASGAMVPRGSQALIQFKESGGNYITAATLDRYTPGLEVSAPGTYRVRRQAHTTAFGVDQT